MVEARAAPACHAAPASAATAPGPGTLRDLLRLRWLLVVLALGVVARAALVPVTHGQDFTVWDLASTATLQGHDVYAHHPAYPGGPYAYLPLFLYCELPMQWLAMHTPIPFLVSGKLPIVVADLVVGLLLASLLRRHGQAGGPTALAAALWLLNPLVLYNGAFYGRFDSVCLALLLAALSSADRGGVRSPAAVVWLGLAVAAKTFPVLLLPAALRRARGGRLRGVGIVVGVLLLVCAPYLLHDPGALVRDQLYNADKPAGSLSWQIALRGPLSHDHQLLVASALLVVVVAGALLLSGLDDVVVLAAATLLLFLVCSKVLIEQYLLWPLPFLAILAVGRRSRPAGALIVVLTTTGMLVNPYVHPLGREPVALDVGLAVALVVGIATLLRGRSGGRRAALSRS